MVIVSDSTANIGVGPASDTGASSSFREQLGMDIHPVSSQPSQDTRLRPPRSSSKGKGRAQTNAPYDSRKGAPASSKGHQSRPYQHRPISPAHKGTGKWSNPSWNTWANWDQLSWGTDFTGTQWGKGKGKPKW